MSLTQESSNHIIDDPNEIFQYFADEWYGDWIWVQEENKNHELRIVPFYHRDRPHMFNAEASTVLVFPFIFMNWKILLMNNMDYKKR